jgi:hypothetical protein
VITPEEIVRRAERLYAPFLRAWMRGEPFFPQTLPIGRLPADYLELSVAVPRLLKGAKASRGFGYSVVQRTQQTRRHGVQSLPERIVIESERDLLRLIGKEEEFAAFQRDMALIRKRMPRLGDWVERQPQRVIEHADEWPDLLQVCEYFVAHPRSGLYIRELPIAVHTKFIETHTGILRRLLDEVLPASAIDPAATSFEQRFGLRYDEPLVRIRLLDMRLQQHLHLPISDLSTPLSQCAALALGGHRCLTVENKMTFLTLPPLAETFAIFGGGFNVELLKSIPWLADCPLLYWGDLDAQGFQILSLLRANFPHTISVMMDAATLEAFRQYAVPGVAIAAASLPHLTPDEHALFERLAREQIRLEQERIPLAYAIERFHTFTL